MTKEQDVFLKILAYGLNKDSSMPPPSVDSLDWNEFIFFCENQGVVGIGFQSIEKLKNNLGDKITIHQDLLLQLIGDSELIKARNQLMNRRTKELTRYLKDKGRRSCILKGQGSALLYSNPLLRIPGDIDVWLEGSKKEIVEFVHSQFPAVNVEYHHMQFPVFDDVEVEVHYYPSFCYNKWYNMKLQHFFSSSREEQFQNKTRLGFYAPTVTFNLVFQLSHMMRHFFTQGIGLRHAIDYYFLLQQDITKEQSKELINVLKSCGMYKFFCAVLWIEKEIFCSIKNKDIAPANSKAGQMVLHEMLKGGDLGRQYQVKGSNVITTYAKQMAYRIGFITVFPSEPLSRPLALIWDYFHKKYSKWK